MSVTNTTEIIIKNKQPNTHTFLLLLICLHSITGENATSQMGHGQESYLLLQDRKVAKWYLTQQASPLGHALKATACTVLPSFPCLLLHHASILAQHHWSKTPQVSVMTISINNSCFSSRTGLWQRYSCSTAFSVLLNSHSPTFTWISPGQQSTVLWPFTGDGYWIDTGI